MPPDDPLACVLGRLDIPRQGYDDDLLLDFYQRFTAVQEGVPDCRLCDFRKAQRLRCDGEIDLTSPEVRTRLASNPGFVRQSEQAEEAANTKARAPVVQLVREAGRHDHRPPGRAGRHHRDGRPHLCSPGRFAEPDGHPAAFPGGAENDERRIREKGLGTDVSGSTAHGSMQAGEGVRVAATPGDLDAWGSRANLQKPCNVGT